jgi:type IV fimbrial biogenesis protein FimT
MNRQHAFTLIELMVTLAVLGIGLMVAVPSFISITNTNRTASQTNSLIGALNYARNEATTRSSPVSVCTSNTGTSCVTGIGWTGGWIVFVDGGTQGQVDAGDQVLRVYGATSPGSTISTSAALTNYISYSASGISSGQGDFILCDSSGTASARKVSVTRIGRVSLQTGAGVGTCTAS